MSRSGIRRKDVEVRISRRTLWVDATAYPLAHVTKIQPLEVTVKRGRLVLNHLRVVGSWLVLGVLGLIVLGCLGNTVPPEATTVGAVVLLAVLVAITVRLIRRLSFGTLHVLSIGIAGTQRAAVLSRDGAEISRLAQRVVDAIDDPALEYTIHIENIEVAGDLVNGPKVGGDVVFGNQAGI